MNIILFDEPLTKINLLPFTFIRPIGHLRVGILKISQKWEIAYQSKVSFLTESYLQAGFPLHFGKENLYINAAFCPNPALLVALADLAHEEALMLDNEVVALKTSKHFLDFASLKEYLAKTKNHRYTNKINAIRQVWDIFLQNRSEIIADFEVITKGRRSEPITDRFTAVYGQEQIFVEQGANIKAAILNAETGPIYIGKNAVVGEGAIIRGAFALCQEAHLSPAAKMRGDTTIGDYAKVGGEIGNSVIFGYSNKAHDGYMGNSVIGEWCNLGADTNTSNLKNNYGKVDIWSFAKGDFVNTGQQFCGLMMGDHVKCGINTMFNTGTVVGVHSNIFGGDFPPKFIPPFSWGGARLEPARLDKMIEIANRMMERRGLKLSEHELAVAAHLHKESLQFFE